MPDYVSVIYRKKPKTSYPFKLIHYLCKRFCLKKGDRILEIGCGRGEFLEEFQKAGLECLGTDIANSSIKNLNINVRKADISKDKLPFKDNTFDIVYHKSLIEHLYSPENLLKETYRVLKPEGITVILTPDWISQMKIFYEDYTHSRPYDRTSLYDALKIHGFSNVKTERFYQLPILWEHSFFKIFTIPIRFIVPVPASRKLAELTGLKFIRWASELMVLGFGYKENRC